MDLLTSQYDLRTIVFDDLHQAFIQFQTQQTSHVILKVVNSDDKEVRILLNEELSKGVHSVPFSFGSLSGDYNIRLMVNMQHAIDMEYEIIKINLK